ncbi:MAG TPA: FAD-dependent monooxygenase, partial [Candidatus Eremiobacteraceae bacterium]|nr:FAD-dependent monooxygenase [Candidatus Eremiobacteraceae bacterium]
FARNPLGGDRVNAMLVTSRPHTGIEADRIARAISAGRRGFDERALERRVAVGPLHYRPRAIARGRVLLCGDAAGLLDPFVGQGVAIALESSHAVVRAVRGILAGSASRARAAFVAERKAAVLPRTMLAAAVETLIRVRFLRERARRGLARDPRPAETVLAAVAGAVPAREALSLSALAGLLA